MIPSSVHPGRKVEAQFKGLPLWGAVRERLGSAVSCTTWPCSERS